MKKNLFRFGLALATLFAVVACGDDADEKKDGPALPKETGETTMEACITCLLPA